MFHLRLVLLSALLIFWLLQIVDALPHLRHHNARNVIIVSDKHGDGKKHEKLVSTQQSRSNGVEAIKRSKLQSMDEKPDATPAADADYPASDMSDLSMWEYNIFPDVPLNYNPDDEDYYNNDYLSDLQLESDDDYDEGPSIQELILLAATHPRRNRNNVFGLPPREVVIY